MFWGHDLQDIGTLKCISKAALQKWEHPFSVGNWLQIGQEHQGLLWAVFECIIGAYSSGGGL